MGLVEYIVLNFLLLIICSRYTVYGCCCYLKFVLNIRRYLVVQQITVCGNKLYTQTLGRNGSGYIVDLYGVQSRQFRTQKEHAIVHLGLRRLWRYKMHATKCSLPFVYANTQFQRGP